MDETDDVNHDGDIEEEHEDTSLEEGELVSDSEDEKEDTEEDADQNENEVADDDIEDDEQEDEPEDGVHEPLEVEQLEDAGLGIFFGTNTWSSL